MSRVSARTLTHGTTDGQTNKCMNPLYIQKDKEEVQQVMGLPALLVP